MMALCGAGFARWGQNDLAARIATTFYAESTLAADPDAALLFAGAMTAARRLPESLMIAEEIDASAASPETNTSFLFTLTPRRHTPSLTEAEKEAYAKAIEDRIRRREKAGEMIAASREAISLANHFRYEVKGDAAVSFYERAAELDPDYLERVHYWHELGGAYFLPAVSGTPQGPMPMRLSWTTTLGTRSSAPMRSSTPGVTPNREMKCGGRFPKSRAFSVALSTR